MEFFSNIFYNKNERNKIYYALNKIRESDLFLLSFKNNNNCTMTTLLRDGAEWPKELRFICNNFYHSESQIKENLGWYIINILDDAGFKVKYIQTDSNLNALFNIIVDEIYQKYKVDVIHQRLK